MAFTYISNQIEVKASLRVQNSTAAAGAINGTGVDISNYEGAINVVVDAPVASTADTITFTVEHSEDNSAFGAVPAAALVDANGDPDTFTVVTDALAVFETLTLKRDQLKRYVRVVATTAGGTINVNFAAYLICQKATY